MVQEILTIPTEHSDVTIKYFPKTEHVRFETEDGHYMAGGHVELTIWPDTPDELSLWPEAYEGPIVTSFDVEPEHVQWIRYELSKSDASFAKRIA